MISYIPLKSNLSNYKIFLNPEIQLPLPLYIAERFFTLLEHYGVISYKVKKSSQILFHLKAFHLYHNFYFSLLYNSF